VSAVGCLLCLVGGFGDLGLGGEERREEGLGWVGPEGGIRGHRISERIWPRGVGMAKRMVTM
jgi:hypothetical protein